MNNIKEKKLVFLKIVFCYYIFISFLFPRGYISLNNTYKIFSTMLIWSSVLLILIYIGIKNIKKGGLNRKLIIEKNYINIIFYFILVILITIIRRGELTGLQQLIAYPSICIFTISFGKKNLKILLNCVNNIMLILFILNILMNKLFFIEQYHITFLGHVQMISQIGVLAVFTVMLYDILYNEKKIRKNIIIILVGITLIITDASLALMTAILLIVLFIVSKTRFNKVLLLDSKIYIVLGIIFSIVIVLISICNNVYNNNYISWLDFSGRSFVWKDALTKIFMNPLLGYGLYGTNGQILVALIMLIIKYCKIS